MGRSWKRAQPQGPAPRQFLTRQYRGADGTGISPDPADPEKTFRVLTLYVAEDLFAKTNPHAEPTPAKEQQSDATRATGTHLR